MSPGEEASITVWIVAALSTYRVAPKTAKRDIGSDTGKVIVADIAVTEAGTSLVHIWKNLLASGVADTVAV